MVVVLTIYYFFIKIMVICECDSERHETGTSSLIAPDVLFDSPWRLIFRLAAPHGDHKCILK